MMFFPLNLDHICLNTSIAMNNATNSCQRDESIDDIEEVLLMNISTSHNIVS